MADEVIVDAWVECDASYFILRCDLYCVSLKSGVYSDKTNKDWKGFPLSVDVTDNFVIKCVQKLIT